MAMGVWYVLVNVLKLTSVKHVINLLKVKILKKNIYFEC